jgi:hypothetical protein
MTALRKYTVRERLLYFIRMREEARLRKELVGGSPPYSSDAIIGAYRFCNINREHDAVTKWIKTNVRDKFSPYGKRVLVPQVLTARIFNEPATLERILPVSDVNMALRKLRAMRAEGHKLMRGAYMMPVHGSNGLGKHAEEYYMAAVGQAQYVDWTQCHTLEGVAERLLRLVGIGDFLANQVCTDLRYTPQWEMAPDWQNFVLCGPGSRRGIDRYDIDDRVEDEKRLGTKRYDYYQARILAIREQLWGLVSVEVDGYFNDINNLSNTFCEFDKFERALWADKLPSLRKYTTKLKT